jgi:hypothetical protein
VRCSTTYSVYQPPVPSMIEVLAAAAASDCPGSTYSKQRRHPRNGRSFENTWSPYIGPSSGGISALSDKSCYRLKLTLWYIDKDRLTPNNSMVIRKRFPTAAAANDEAFELAQCCLGEGESVMLADRTMIGDETLNEYAIGKWDTARVEIPMDSREFPLHRPNPYFKRNTLSTLSGLIQVHP